MNPALMFTRILFAILSIFFMTVYMISGQNGATLENIIKGVGLGALLSCLLISSEFLFRRFNLRAFNTAIVGIFVGYFMGQALDLVLDAVLIISSASIHISPELLEICKITLFLFGVYLGTLMTLRAADELYVTIPFIRFTPTAHKKKDLLLDFSILSDPRILDLASSGVVDNHLVIPRFIVKEFYAQAEGSDEHLRAKAKRALETVKKLEHTPSLELRYHDTDFPDIKDPMGKMLRLARLIDANLLTADISRVQISSIEGVRIINIQALATALKPLMQTGEHITIKVQRYGKEPRQGIGYLEDGTMVVINGGGQFIGETIEAQVLSVKHTSSGRIIFCNAADDDNRYPTIYPEDSED
jgi:uncharacterized protein YacL